MSSLMHWLLHLLSPTTAQDDRLNHNCLACMWNALWTGEVEFCERCHYELRRGYQSHAFNKGGC